MSGREDSDDSKSYLHLHWNTCENKSSRGNNSQHPILQEMLERKENKKNMLLFFLLKTRQRIFCVVTLLTPGETGLWDWKWYLRFNKMSKNQRNTLTKVWKLGTEGYCEKYQLWFVESLYFHKLWGLLDIFDNYFAFKGVV